MASKKRVCDAMVIISISFNVKRIVRGKGAPAKVEAKIEWNGCPTTTTTHPPTPRNAVILIWLWNSLYSIEAQAVVVKVNDVEPQ